MKKHIIYLFSSVVIAFALLGAADSSNSKPQNNAQNNAQGNNQNGSQDKPNDSKKVPTGADLQKLFNSQNSPGEFQTQEIMQNMFGGEAFERANSGDISSLVDSKITNIKHEGVQSYVDVKRSGVLDKATEAAKNAIGNTAVKTGRASCYIARGQSFYNYQCSLNGVMYGSPDNAQSPTKAKQNCEKSCYTAGRCYEVTSSADTQQKEVIEDIGSVTFNAKNLKPFSKNSSMSGDKKAKGLTFELTSNAPVYFSFKYTDETGYQRILANKVQISDTIETQKPAEQNNQGQSNGNQNNGTQGQKASNTAQNNTQNNTQNKNNAPKKIVKTYLISQKVKDYSISFEVPEEYENQKDLEIKIEKIKITVPKMARFACSNQNLYFKEEKRKNCSPAGRVILQSPEGPIEICKYTSSGDNDDGTFSTMEGCQATCRNAGECIMKNPAMNQEQFFGFQEGCLLESKECSNTGCRDSREQNAAILNEKVYDGKGNVTETIKNGIPVPGVVRPRVVAEGVADYNQKIQSETKDLAFANMVKNQTYNKTLALNVKRESSYAIQAEPNKDDPTNKTLNVMVKPSDALYDKTSYLYIMLRVESNSKDFIELPNCKPKFVQTCNNNTGNSSDNLCYIDPSTGNRCEEKNGDKCFIDPTTGKDTTMSECLKRDNSFRSYHYFLLDGNGAPQGFYRHQGFNRADYTHNGNRFQTFNGTKWVEGGEGNQAAVFKTYNDLLAEVKKNKYYLKEEITKNTTKLLDSVQGLPKIRAYASFANGMTGIMLGEIYNYVKSSADIPAHIVAQNNGKQPKLKGSEAPINYVVYALISDKQLTHRDVWQQLIEKEEKTSPIHAIYNWLEIDSQDYIIRLPSDGTMGEEIVQVYLVGNAKKLSAYGNVTSRQEDIGQNGYLFYWTHDNGGDPAKGSITNIKPNSQEIREFKEFMPAALNEYEIFLDKDFTKEAANSLKFGYGTGDYNAESDCKVMASASGGKAQKICLPWWRIEREYDSKMDKSVAMPELRAVLGKMKLPAQGKQVNVCTKVDPVANAIYNKEEQTVTCTSYYNRLTSPDCYANPLQKKCFTDNCPTKVKEHCTLTNTIAFSPLKTKVQVDDVTAAGQDINRLEETKVEVKTYGYKCPPTIKTKMDGLKPIQEFLELNQVCLKEEAVMMKPAVCPSSGATNGGSGGTGNNGGGTSGNNSGTGNSGNSNSGNSSNGGSSGNNNGNTAPDEVIPGSGVGGDPTENATIDEILSGKSNLVYCNTGAPIITATGELTGFRGTCPTTRQQVTCGFDKLATTTRKCVDPVMQSQKEEKVETINQERQCTDVYVNVAKGESDIYKDDPSCYRANTAADSKKGTVSVNFRQDIDVIGLLISKNRESQQTVEYCTYNGSQGKMQGNCTSNSGKKTLNFVSTLTDSQEILFAEQITKTDGGEDLGGWDVNKGIDATYVYGEGRKGDAMQLMGMFGQVYEKGSAAFEQAQKDRPGAWVSVGDIVPGNLLGSSTEYISSAVSASVGSNNIALLPDLKTPNFQLTWRRCHAPNVKRISFQDVLAKGYFPTDGHWEWKGFWTSHLHSYKWKIYMYDGCQGHGAKGISNHWHYETSSKVNLFTNSGAGLSILFPTPSNYEIYFFNTEGGLMHKEVVHASQLTTKQPGQMNVLRLGDRAKLYENGQETTQRLACSDDDLSPVGGGTLYGLHSVTKAVCPVARDKKFILANSIAAVSVVDLDTKLVTTKKLTYPLPFINRIYYGYAQSVESRRYSCCQDFN